MKAKVRVLLAESDGSHDLRPPELVGATAVTPNSVYHIHHTHPCG